MKSFLLKPVKLPKSTESIKAFCGICEKEVGGRYVDTPDGKYFECVYGHRTRKWVK